MHRLLLDLRMFFCGCIFMGQTSASFMKTTVAIYVFLVNI